jgi:glycosyltransferase involved in cell wall biosynthesis
VIKLKNTEKTIVLGLEHFIDKIGYQANEYKRRGIPVKYLVNDVAGLSELKAKQYNADVDIVPINLLARLLKTLTTFMTYKPKWCELYDTGRLTLFYALIALIFRTKLIIILRGQEFNRHGFRAFGLKLSLNLCHHIISKESNLTKSLLNLSISSKKITEIPNCVLLPESSVIKSDKDIDILFLNSVREERHVDLLLYAVKQLSRNIPNLKVVITGFSSLDDNKHQVDIHYEKKILAMIHELDLDTIIETKGFVPEPSVYYRRARVFVLPANVVFLNYSLLEAMSYGVAPIVCRGEGAAKIIEHNYNGKIVDFISEELAEEMKKMLTDSLYTSYGKAARNTIEEQHTMQTWGDHMTSVKNKIKKDYNE